MKPATRKLRELLAKLEALAAAPGTPEEGAAAAAKVAKLRARYDFTVPDISKDDLFRGKFQRSASAVPVARLADVEIANSVKWAIEAATGIPCIFRDAELLAEATPGTARKLGQIAATITEGFSALWSRFGSAPGVHPADRGNFIAGLYDGMMNEQRTGQALPLRAVGTDRRAVRAKRRALNHAPGLNLHPYSVAVDLGRQIRFSVPLSEITNQLETALCAQLEN